MPPTARRRRSGRTYAPRARLSTAALVRHRPPARQNNSVHDVGADTRSGVPPPSALKDACATAGRRPKTVRDAQAARGPGNISCRQNAIKSVGCGPKAAAGWHAGSWRIRSVAAKLLCIRQQPLNFLPGIEHSHKITTISMITLLVEGCRGSSITIATIFQGPWRAICCAGRQKVRRRATTARAMEANLNHSE
jgi:hypothetical protein